MSTDLTRRPADLATKRSALVATATTGKRPIRDEDGVFYARRGGPTGPAVFGLFVALLLLFLFAGFALSLLHQS